MLKAFVNVEPAQRSEDGCDMRKFKCTGLIRNLYHCIYIIKNVVKSKVKVKSFPEPQGPIERR